MQTAEGPLYLQIRSALEREILETRRPGERLDTEVHLAERFQVNRHTLRRAIDDLVARGLVERRRGLGLYVLEPTFDYPLHAETRLTANLAHMGVAGQRTFLRRYAAPADFGTAQRLGLVEGAPVICLESLIMAGERSLSLATHFLPQERFPRLLEEFTGGSLHQHLQSAHGLKLKRVGSTIAAIFPTAQDASTLRIPRTIPILLVKSLNVAVTDGRPVEYVESRFRADRIELSVKF